MSKIRTWIARALVVAVIAGPTAACDFVKPTTANPNAVPSAQLNQLFVTAQLIAWFNGEATLSRYPAMWLEQMHGSDRQFVTLGRYIIGEQDADDEWLNAYLGGGLIDLRQAQQTASDNGDRVYLGILKIHEAFIVATIASTWGDIPYSEAVSLPEITTPALDEQAAVYAAVQALLDSAIADLQSGAGPGPGSADLVFGGNAAAWIAVAHTLKARYHMHWAEADAGRYAQALAEANQGIMDPSGNWRAQHGSSSTENNLWFMFMRDRSGYISAGEYLVELLKDRGDPRIAFYFDQVDGEYVGGTSAQPDPQASPLSTDDGYGAADFDFPLVTCAENAGIGAEAAFQTGDAGGAAMWVNRLIACQEAFWGVDLPPFEAPLDLEEIIDQKYMAGFLSIEVWNDYKRTCLPAIVPYEGGPIPGRLNYPEAERIANPNIPSVAQQPARNDNDPNAC